MLVGLDDPWSSYCLDEATFAWGTYVDSEMQEAGDKVPSHIKDEQSREAHRRMALDAASNRLFNDPEPTEVEVADSGPVAKRRPAGRFRDPMQDFSK